MSEIDQLKEQMIELQSQLAFQEDSVQALNDAMALQQQEIIVLRRQMQLLKLRQEEEQAASASGQSPSEADERPPHY